MFLRENITELIERNRVVVISGETGCGKTTQVSWYRFQFNLSFAYFFEGSTEAVEKCFAN